MYVVSLEIAWTYNSNHTKFSNFGLRCFRGDKILRDVMVD